MPARDVSPRMHGMENIPFQGVRAHMRAILQDLVLSLMQAKGWDTERFRRKACPCGSVEVKNQLKDYRAFFVYLVHAKRSPRMIVSNPNTPTHLKMSLLESVHSSRPRQKIPKSSRLVQGCMYTLVSTTAQHCSCTLVSTTAHQCDCTLENFQRCLTAVKKNCGVLDM